MTFFLVSGEEEGVEVVEKLVGVDLRRPPTMLRRGRGPSMVGGMVDLLHGLEIERESEKGMRVRERERAGGGLVGVGLGLTRGSNGVYVAAM